MLQHAILYARPPLEPDKVVSKKQVKFVSDHSMFRASLSTLKKITITEMKHAEVIAERIVCLGGEATMQPDPITLGRTARDILLTNTKAEQGAIVLYEHIIRVAERERDETTKNMFQ